MNWFIFGHYLPLLAIAIVGLSRLKLVTDNWSNQRREGWIVCVEKLLWNQFTSKSWSLSYRSASSSSLSTRNEEISFVQNNCLIWPIHCLTEHPAPLPESGLCNMHLQSLVSPQYWFWATQISGNQLCKTKNQISGNQLMCKTKKQNQTNTSVVHVWVHNALNGAKPDNISMCSSAPTDNPFPMARCCEIIEVNSEADLDNLACIDFGSMRTNLVRFCLTFLVLIFCIVAGAPKSNSNSILLFRI